MVFMGYIIVSSIQLGATVDYSILLTNNYVSCRKTLPKKKEACIQALMLSCPSILLRAPLSYWLDISYISYQPQRPMGTWAI